MAQWTVRLEAQTSAGEVNTTELVTFSRPRVVSTLAEIGLLLAETKMLLAKLQASMLCGQVAKYAAYHRVCAAWGVLQPLKDRRTRRLQTPDGAVTWYFGVPCAAASDGGLRWQPPQLVVP